MGLIKAAVGAIGGTLADQWIDYFYCESMPPDILAVKGRKRAGDRSSNKKSEENIITEGSAIAVADGQCMIIVEQGMVADICDMPGEYTYGGGEPSLFAGGSLGDNAKASLKSAFERFKRGGIPGKDARIYYINTKELVGNKYGTPNPVPFRVVDQNIGLDMDISIRCFGEYSYRVENPILFYKNVCGNMGSFFSRESLDGQLKSELMTALQPTFAKISAMGIRYSALPGHTQEMADALNEALSSKWVNLRGISIVSVGVSSVTANEEDEKAIKELQRNATFRNPTMAAAHLVGAQASAMQSAAANTNAGPAMAFMGMNMAGAAGGMNAQELFAMGQAAAQPQAAQPPQQAGGQAAQVTQPQPQRTTEAQGLWKCRCGAQNSGRFCPECGSAAPVPATPLRCANCSWEPQPGSAPPKFCPECGSKF